MLMISSQYHRILQTNLQPLSNIHLGFPPSFALLATTKFNPFVKLFADTAHVTNTSMSWSNVPHGLWGHQTPRPWSMARQLKDAELLCCFARTSRSNVKDFKEKVDRERLAISFSYRSKCLQLLDIDYLQFYLWAVLSMSHRTSVALELWQLYAVAAFTPCL